MFQINKIVFLIGAPLNLKIAESVIIENILNYCQIN